MHKDTYVSKDKLSEEFKAFIGVTDWRPAEETMLSLQY